MEDVGTLTQDMRKLDLVWCSLTGFCETSCLYIQAFCCPTPHSKIHKLTKFFVGDLSVIMYRWVFHLKNQMKTTLFFHRAVIHWADQKGSPFKHFFTFIDNEVSRKCYPQESRSCWLRLGNLLASDLSPLIRRWKLISPRLQWWQQGDRGLWTDGCKWPSYCCLKSHAVESCKMIL